MPDPIVITSPETPALSEENTEMLQALERAEQGEEQEQLLAGKYKSVDELEKAYKELQSKLGQRPQQEAAEQGQETDNTESAEGEEEEEGDLESRSAKEIYGDFIGSRLEEAGIDFMDINTRWQQSGELATEDYDALQQAGFSKEMVDAYLSGLQYKASQDSALAVQQIAELKQEYGGEQAYGQMIQWAAQNLSQEEIDGFNEIVNGASMQATRMAIAGLHARYSAVEGREPKLLGGRSPKKSTDVFESTAQVVEAMSDPKYANDPAYRRKVQDKLSRSSIM